MDGLHYVDNLLKRHIWPFWFPCVWNTENFILKLGMPSGDREANSPNKIPLLVKETHYIIIIIIIPGSFFPLCFVMVQHGVLMLWNDKGIHDTWAFVFVLRKFYY